MANVCYRELDGMYISPLDYETLNYYEIIENIQENIHYFYENQRIFYDLYRKKNKKANKKLLKYYLDDIMKPYIDKAFKSLTIDLIECLKNIDEKNIDINDIIRNITTPQIRFSNIHFHNVSVRFGEKYERFNPDTILALIHNKDFNKEYDEIVKIYYEYKSLYDNLT
jgi:hypothetical protein